MGFPFTIDRRAWQHRTRHEYYTASYAKTALALRTLEGLIGERDFARAMRAYFERFRFRHPTGDDFFATFSEVTGDDLTWFFDQAIGSDSVVDWSVLRVRNRPVSKPEGLSWDGSGWEEIAEPAMEEDTSEGEWMITVEIGRRGDFTGPVEVELVFDDASRERRSWDGMDRWIRWSMARKHKLARVVVDPDGVWALETRRRDNYWADEPSHDTARRSLWWVADVLQALALGHLPWS
jgi:hypothetical protein